MAAGGPGDHPVSDICHWGIPVFSDKADSLVKEINKLVPSNKMWELFDWYSPSPLSLFENELERKLIELRSQATSNGWELP